MVAFLALILLSPILLLVILLLAIYQNGSVFFTQPRPGYREQIFHVIKFKTMRDTRDAQGNLLPDAQRLTPIGKFIRSSSLDELPQLINVLKGDMSFVGPRPLLIEYLERYNNTQKRRHDVMPGITGWAQVNGRNQITWEQKFDYDVYYVDHQGFGLDMKILWLSVWKVIKRDGISAVGAATMHKFMGSNSNQEK